MKNAIYSSILALIGIFFLIKSVMAFNNLSTNGNANLGGINSIPSLLQVTQVGANTTVLTTLNNGLVVNGTSTMLGVGELGGAIGISTGGEFGPYGGYKANTQIENDYDATWLMAYRNNDTSYRAGGVTFINYLASCGFMNFSRASSTSPNNVLSLLTLVGIGDQENCVANGYGTRFYAKQGVYFGQGDGVATSTVSPVDSNLVTLGTSSNSWKTIVASSTVQGSDFFAATSTGGIILKTPNGTCARGTLSNAFALSWTTTTCPSL